MWTVLILLAIALVVRYMGNRLLPLAMPKGKLKTIAAGLLGAFLGHLVTRQYHLGDWAVVSQTNLIGAAAGALFFLFALGLIPFFKVFMRRA